MNSPRILALLILLLPASAEATLPFTHETLTLTVPSGTKLTAQLRIPAGLEGPSKKFPALMIFGGFERAADVLDLVHPSEPVILASFDYPFDSDRQMRFPESLKLLPEIKRMTKDSLDGISALTENLQARVDVDPGRISILGASLGSPFAIKAAARDRDKIKGVILVHAFGDARKTAEHLLLRNWRPKYGSLATPAAWALSHALWLYLGLDSPENDAAQFTANQKILLITAQSDTFIPAEARASLWEKIRATPAISERILMEGDHLQPGSEKLIAEILTRIQDWLRRAGMSYFPRQNE